MSYTLNRTGAQIDGIFEKVDSTFFAVYGTTTYAEIGTAITAGKRVFLFKGAQLYGYIGIDGTNSAYIFGQLNGSKAQPGASYIYCATDSSWGEDLVPLATLEQFYASLMEDTASGSIASFPDGAEGVPVKELTADIEPIQDLHGQASPYPEGGGTNKFDLTKFSYTTQNGITFTRDGNDIVISGQANGDAYLNYSAFSVSGTGSNILFMIKSAAAHSEVMLRVASSGGTSRNIGLTTAEASSYMAYDNTETYSGYILVASGANFSTPIRVNVFAATYTDVAPSYSPYSNICPISGYTGAEITVDGVNLFDGIWAQGGINTANGEEYPNANNIRSGFIFVAAESSYYFTIDSGSNSSLTARYLFFYDKDKNWISPALNISNNTAFTTPANCAYVRIRLEKTGITPSWSGLVAINYPSTDTDYHAYNGTTYSVSWADEGTVYKGNLNATTGELTVTHGEKDLGTLTWIKSGTSGMFYVQNVTSWLKMPDGEYDVLDGLCEMYKPASYISAQSDDCVIYSTFATANLKFLYVFDSTHAATSEADFKTAMNGVQFVYALATPQTVQLTPTEVKTLLGDNNIWSDTGDISVKYRANTALYIEKRLGE